VLDHFIAQIDRRSLFTLLNIPNQLPPDGRLTLGQPVALNDGNQHLQVLTYDGHKGENLLGQAVAKPTSPKGAESDFSDVAVRVFAPDGSEIDQDYGMLDGQSLTLPADATYT